MKATIKPTGDMIISPENKNEDYALNKWIEENVNTCKMEIKPRRIWFDTLPREKRHKLHITRKTIWKIFLILGLFWVVLGSVFALPCNWMQFTNGLLLIIIVAIELNED